jgi:tetratricopeptide (TPR) repeat protein
MNQPPSDSGRRYFVVEADDARLRVMISSTTINLPEHRREVSEAIHRMGHTPVWMESGTAEWNSDAIKLSLEMVERSQVYIGIFALRYGFIVDDPVRNPNCLSITELEYRRARELGIPTFIYIAKKTHPFEEDQIDFEPESREKLNRLKSELVSCAIVGFFNDAAELRSLVLQSLHELQVKPRDLVGPPAPRPKILPPAPPAIYAVPEYTLTNAFVGRSSELDLLDSWANSTDSIMVVEGIGGLGKSAVTWEWTQRRAPAAIPKLAGRVWWSFYEKGTSMVTFVRHALAYVTCQDPESLIKDSSHYERGQQLLTELRKRPFLLVLDGFERVLTAYHRLDKAQIPDDQVNSGLRDCINPPDGELLTQLLACTPSKILISTRLFPSHLEDRASHKPIPGVKCHELNGLSQPDALELMRQSGVTGDEKAMIAFADQFGRHSLLLRVVCGMIADYRKKPYDFDGWRADPIYGGGLKLSELELKQRYTHILDYALRGLDEATRKLLCRIAVISEHATYETLAVLNPFLPPRPAEVDEPSDPSKDWRWRRMVDNEKADAQRHFQEELEAYGRYQDALQSYLACAEYRTSVTSFDSALAELEDRGLVQWDRVANHYDMHPVVRGHAAELLEANDRTDTFLKVRDHFVGLPPDDLGRATELAHASHSLEIYRCLVGAGKLDEAAEFYVGELAMTLSAHIGANSVILELMKPLFRNDLCGMPCVGSAIHRADLLNSLAIAYGDLGREERAIPVYQRSLRICLDLADWSSAALSLRNLSPPLGRLQRRSESVAASTLARELAEAADDQEGVFRAISFQMDIAFEQGRFADASKLYAEFRRRQELPGSIYLRGSAEHSHCVGQFYLGHLTESEWQAGYNLSVEHRNVFATYHFLALRAEWDLSIGHPHRASEAIDRALQITNRLGAPRRDYHDLRAWALARLNRPGGARAELASGEQRLFAAETYVALGDAERARECALNAYRWAWGEGPPYIHWYQLERSRALLSQLGEPEPQLPLFDPTKVAPIPFEKEIRAAIERLRAARAAKVNPTQS